MAYFAFCADLMGIEPRVARVRQQKPFKALLMALWERCDLKEAGQLARQVEEGSGIRGRAPADLNLSARENSFGLSSALVSWINRWGDWRA